MIIKVDRMFKFTDETKNIRAFCDVIFGGLIKVNGCRIITGKNGLFVTLPQKKKDDKWEDIVKIISKDLYTEFKDAVLKHYNETAEGQDNSGGSSFDGAEQPVASASGQKSKDEFEE